MTDDTKTAQRLAELIKYCELECGGYAACSCARDIAAALKAARGGWMPIETAPRSAQIICGHSEKYWLRFGRYFGDVGRWYYSGTSERSQYAETAGDAPTHWLPMPAPPVSP